MSGTAGPLIGQIRSRGVAAAAERVTAGRVEADTARAAASDRAQRRRASALAAQARAAAMATSRTRAEAAARLGRDTLAARAAALDRIFVEADRAFAALATRPGLGDLLARSVRDGLSYLPDGSATVACRGAIAEAVRAAVAVAARADVSVRVDDRVPMGVRIEAGDGSVSVDATFAQWLARERPRISTVLARRIVEGAA